MLSGRDEAWSWPKRVAELCRTPGSRPEEGGVDGGSGGLGCIAGSSTVLGRSTASDFEAGAAIRAQAVAGEEGSAVALTSGDKYWNPNLRGGEARREEN